VAAERFVPISLAQHGQDSNRGQVAALCFPDIRLFTRILRSESRSARINLHSRLSASYPSITIAHHLVSRLRKFEPLKILPSGPIRHRYTPFYIHDV
jgi:hypothetical protein